MALVGKTTEEMIYNFLKAQGFTDAGATGMIGNLYAESGLSSINLQNNGNKTLGMTDEEFTKAFDNGTYTNFVHDSYGYGIAQWTYWSRKQGLMDYSKSKGVSIGNLEMQLEYLMQELNQGYKSLLNVLRTSDSVSECSNGVLLQFERPASVGANATEQQRQDTCNKRADYAQTYYDKLCKNTSQSLSKGGNSMKYSDSNKPLVCMQTQSTCYRKTSKMKILGVLWHSTGANNPYIKRYVQPSDNDPKRDEWLKLLGKNQYANDWNHIEHQAGLNCWVGKLADGTVTTVQTMPWDYKPWGCGGGCNNGWIQFEICEDSLTDTDYFNTVYKEACEITAYLCKMYGIDPKGTVQFNGKKVPTILCHWDSYKLGLGSGHSDIYHWFGKYGKDMDNVRNDVATLMSGASTVTNPSVSTIVNYQAKVIANDGLNCRTQPYVANNLIMTYPTGTILTITKEQDGWGYTGTGWVSLNYVEKMQNVVEGDDYMTKAQILNELGDKYISTYNELPDWAKPDIRELLDKQIINGGTDFTTDPDDINMTLSQIKAIIVCKRMIERQ